jgi:hypothetical protein
MPSIPPPPPSLEAGRFGRGWQVCERCSQNPGAHSSSSTHVLGSSREPQPSAYISAAGTATRQHVVEKMRRQEVTVAGQRRR